VGSANAHAIRIKAAGTGAAAVGAIAVLKGWGEGLPHAKKLEHIHSSASLNAR
jgi:hypothetical protein